MPKPISSRHVSATRAACVAALIPIIIPIAAGAQTARRPMTFEDFAATRWVSDPQLSPDGRAVLYTVRVSDLAANKRSTGTFLLALAGGKPRPFPADGVSASEARWSPDGRRVVYVADGQLWIADASGTGARQLTKLDGDVDGPVWSPTGDRIAFTSRVRPHCATVECLPVHPDSQSRGMVYEHLLYRHWTAYDDGTRSHLFVIAPDGSGMRDLIPDAPYDVPPGPFGGSEGYAFSPDGRELAYTAKNQGRANAWSTDINLYLMPVQGGTPVVLTAANHGGDQNPVYSPDGRWLLYQSQAQPGFESDQWRLMAYDRRAHTTARLVPRWDRNADVYTFAPDSRSIYIQTADAGRDKIFRISAGSGPGGWSATPAPVIVGHNNSALTVGAGGVLAWERDAVDHAPELYAAVATPAGVTGEHQLTHENDVMMARLQLHPAEDYWFRSGGDSVQGFVVKPPQWTAGKKFPVLLIIHGGPQSPFLDQWHPRWNFSMFASRGTAIVFINPHGSPGYGQRFTNEVSKDWGGQPYRDLMTGLDVALRRNASWMDSTRTGAAGASYGGYMVNWIAGHTHRFRALFTHDGVWNLEAMYGSTEELWFPEWEFGGPYWDPHAMATQYRRWSPHLFAGNLRTPHLVSQGELDYRVPFAEGAGLFTALQRQGVPSKFIIFPDEGHFVTKPANQRLWYNEVLSWFDYWLNR